MDSLPSVKQIAMYAWCTVFVILSIFIVEHSTNAQAWTQDIQPTLKIKYEQKWPVFFGNQSDYFQILEQDDNSVLIGARNAMYNISLKNLLENQSQRLEWESTPAHRELCTLKGKQDSDCQNYIRVFARIDDHKIMVCGTNSYKPLCRRYKNGAAGSIVSLTSQEDESAEVEGSTTSENAVASVSSSTESETAAFAKNSSGETFELIEEIDGQGRCPYNPTHNSSYIFTDDQLYSATAADFSGGDALIYRDTQRTEQFNAKQLNQPSFVSTVERNGYVFFFFRELALENCGKTIYSRVARVCKNDRGGPSHFRERWTSYLKTRLNCSTPGDFPFYFDELQGTTGIIDGLYQAALNQKQQIRNYHTHSRTDDSTKSSALKPNSLIYAVFTTPQNAIPGSAVCAFQIDDIIDTFEGNFKGQKDTTSNWLPIPPSEVPDPRPGKCVDDSRELPMRTINFVKMHTLMESSVPALYGRPVLTRVAAKNRFTAITTDAQVEALNGDKYDVLFIGTDNGHVIKTIHFVRSTSNDSKSNQNGFGEQHTESESSLETIVVSETQAFSRSLPVKQMTVSKLQQSLVVVGSGVMVSIPIHHCAHRVSCKECLNLRDPYCVWDTKNHECTSIKSVSSHNRMNFIQNIRQSRKETTEMCGDDNENRIDAPVPKEKGRSISTTGNVQTNLVSGSEKPIAQPSVVSTRGTVSSVFIGPSASSGGSKMPDERENEVQPENQIASHFSEFGNDNGFDNDDSSEPGVVESGNFDAHLGNSNQIRFASPLFVIVVFIVFATAFAFGFIVSKRFEFTTQSAFDILRGGSGGSGSSHHHLSEHHRNQLNFYDKSTGGGRNASCKDVNLLMNVMGPYIAAGGPNNVNGRSTLTNTGCQTPNNLDKKDILELEFETKDRSHECKNSTEHLDINDLKVNANNNTNCNNQTTTPQAVIVNSTNTGTLQKVKKTYL